MAALWRTPPPCGVLPRGQRTFAPSNRHYQVVPLHLLRLQGCAQRQDANGTPARAWRWCPLHLGLLLNSYISSYDSVYGADAGPVVFDVRLTCAQSAHPALTPPLWPPCGWGRRPPSGDSCVRPPFPVMLARDVISGAPHAPVLQPIRSSALPVALQRHSCCLSERFARAAHHARRMA